MNIKNKEKKKKRNTEAILFFQCLILTSSMHAMQRTCYDEKFRRRRLHQLNLTHYAHICTPEIAFRAHETRHRIMTDG
jgi:hypothetical protein